jgi:8-amino-7-oxononanoate synthase
MPFAELRAGLESRRKEGLWRTRRTLESAQGAFVGVDGARYLSFCSNDYLGLANHPALVEAACRGARDWGVGAGASHLVSGHFAPHERLEEALATFVGQARALLFSTGYMANLGAVTALVGRGDHVFADRLNHASLNDAMVLSRARLHRYPHGDVAALGRALAAAKGGRKLIVTDGVFSMDGDLAPLPEMLALAEAHDAWLLVDDAHGFGVLGKGGRGVLAHFSLAAPRFLYLGTLGKAAGVFGAFVAGPQEVIEHLLQTSRPYGFTTALPPLVACALAASLDLIAREDWRRERLTALQARLKAGLPNGPWQLLPSGTPIQPLVVGENARAQALGETLRHAGILVPAIRPPTVPKGSARLRISLSAAHREEDVDHLLAALAKAAG